MPSAGPYRARRRCAVAAAALGALLIAAPSARVRGIARPDYLTQIARAAFLTQ